MHGGVSSLVVGEVAEARRVRGDLLLPASLCRTLQGGARSWSNGTPGPRSPGQPRTWTADIARELVDEDQGVIDELALFFRAMIARARLGAIAASILIDEGSYDVALRMLHQTKATMRTDYFDLHNRLRALAGHDPEPGVLDKVPLLKKAGRGMSAREKVQALAGGAGDAIGDRLLHDQPALESFVAGPSR